MMVLSDVFKAGEGSPYSEWVSSGMAALSGWTGYIVPTWPPSGEVGFSSDGAMQTVCVGLFAGLRGALACGMFVRQRS